MYMESINSEQTNTYYQDYMDRITNLAGAYNRPKGASCPSRLVWQQRNM
jgi:hypothetical protein